MGNYLAFDTYWELYYSLEEMDPATAAAFAGFFTSPGSGDGNYYVSNESAYVAWVMRLVGGDADDAAQFLNWGHTEGGLSTQSSYGS